jgi:hypothetical protein
MSGKWIAWTDASVPTGRGRRILGDFMATERGVFGLLEPNLVPRPSVYGTEGRRFESCRARSLFPVVEGD